MYNAIHDPAPDDLKAISPHVVVKQALNPVSHTHPHVSLRQACHLLKSTCLILPNMLPQEQTPNSC